MCGVAGFWGAPAEADALRATAVRMARTLAHRGPDGEGAWVDAAAGVAFGHRRLAIVDLSAEGAQPMTSPSGRYVITFNGEIYNHVALRAELGDVRFRGHSDTEVLLAAFDTWGFDRALERANGMFAFALWDAQERRLRLACDRLGEKPLYHGRFGGAFLFGSELKALAAHPAFRGEIDRDALALFMRLDRVPAPQAIFRGVEKLAPGTVLTLAAPGGTGEQRAYWSARAVLEAGTAEPLPGRPAEIVEQVDALLRDAVALRMQADVPLGAFLSGGIDSSTIVALMQAQSARPVRTFTIRFREPEMNEADYAARIATHLGTHHTEELLGAQECLELIPRLPELWDEPFGDSSQIPTHLVARVARQHVTVALSGDAGDELFGGYHRHFWRLWERIGRVPAPLRRVGARALGRLPQPRLRKLGAALHAASAEDLYVTMTSRWREPVVLGARELPWAATDPSRWAKLDEPTRRIMFLDLTGYLPDQILVKVDRATMGVGLEGRMPFLDHRLVELAARIPLGVLFHHAQGKWPLRRILERHVPPRLTDRPKHGFSVPVAAWLRGPLRPWVEALLAEDRLRREGFLDPAAVRRAWDDHLSGRVARHHELWNVLMFQAWLDAPAARPSAMASSSSA